MYFVYLLQSLKDNSWYTGYTSNLKERLKRHNQGFIFATKNKRPWKLIYYEFCLDREDAIAREKYLKSGQGKRYLRNRLKNFFRNF